MDEEDEQGEEEDAEVAHLEGEELLDQEASAVLDEHDGTRSDARSEDTVRYDNRLTSMVLGLNRAGVSDEAIVLAVQIQAQARTLAKS